MGFLDKLLGRGKDAAESAGEATKDAGSKVTDVASDVGDKAEDASDEVKDRVSGGDEGSEATQADQALRDEGRTP